jgi:hypothetical protein
MEQLVQIKTRAITGRRIPSQRRLMSQLGRRAGFLIIGAIATIAVACGSGDAEAAAPIDSTATQISTPQPTVVPTATQIPTVAKIDEAAEQALIKTMTAVWRWRGDLTARRISLTEFTILLLRDQIDPIDEPTFVSVADAPDYMDANAPVVSVIIEGEAKAYPLSILMWHEIVNDTIGGVPVTVTFCPLCNTGIVFERVIDGYELTFGTSGMLRNSDLVMWDRQTESFWQQITGEALVGDYSTTETVLKQVPSSITSWETFADAHPNGKLLERVQNVYGLPAKSYDNPPYAGYDDIDDHPFLFSGTIDDRLVATSRVLTIDGAPPVAYPFTFLKENPVLNDTIDGNAIVAIFDNGTLSAFNDYRNEQQTVGSVAAFSRVVGDRTLTFEATDSGITDVETGSLWNYSGIAKSGELEGTQLELVVHANHFWFAWSVFKPNTVIKDSLDDLAS